MKDPFLFTKLDRAISSLLALWLIFPIITSVNVEAPTPNLFVSAENSMFENHFAGSMVIEVIVNNPVRSDLDNAIGEPDVTINGNDLRMVQASDGNWYAYFANKEKAKIADQIVLDGGAGAAGKGLDFGVFCSSSTAASVLGVSFSNTEGVAIPSVGGISGSTNGVSSFSACTGVPNGLMEQNNVVRQPKSINTNPNVLPGQVGINSNVWPIIQLFSFGDVVVQYNKAGGPQVVELDYDEIPNISLELDRTGYPNNAEVFVTIYDFQLNQDPTDEDSWTFNIDSPEAVFYQAFTESGTSSANGGPGLINLAPYLSSLNFEDNGKLTLNVGSVAKLQTNKQQPDSFVTDGTSTYTQIVTLVESKPNSGIFESFDFGDKSTIGTLGNAPRGQSAIIEYNSKSTSIISGTFTASISLGIGGSDFNPGQRETITLVDVDQNINSGSKDNLDVFRSSAIIPTLKLGNPITLHKTSDLELYADSMIALGSGTVVDFLIPDANSMRLLVDTRSLGTTDIEKISLDLGVSAGDLQSLLIDVSSPGSDGTNWLNYDLRSFEQQLDIKSFSDTSMTLHFGGLPGATIVSLIDPGDIFSGQGLVQIDDADITTISTVSGSSSVFLEINFDSSDDTVAAGKISSETDTQPIVIDLFSFGKKNNQEVNNAIYRFELEETSSNSGTFTGTIEYTITSQVNLFDPNLIKTLRTIDDRVRFLVNSRLIDEEGINIAYSDLAEVGVTINTSFKIDIKTHSGTVSANSLTFGLGRPVGIILNDPDLNLKHDRIDIYSVINDPNSPNVDTVGDQSGNILLEILIKGMRYEGCTINGLQVGGLASTGFSLVETGTDTGIFEGSFKMPTQICDKTGDKLISTAGGSINAKYHDFRDSSGKQNIFGLTTLSSSFRNSLSTNLNSEKFVVPKYKQTTDVILTGKIDDYKQGTSIQLTLLGPDQSSQDFNVVATKQGDYKVVITLYHYSLPGTYTIDVHYDDSLPENISFQVMKHIVPDWIKNNAKWWSSNEISDSEFIGSIEHLIKEKIIMIPDSVKSESTVQKIPGWVKNTASWWSKGLVSDDEFVSAFEFLVKNSIIRI